MRRKRLVHVAVSSLTEALARLIVTTRDAHHPLKEACKTRAMILHTQAEKQGYATTVQLVIIEDLIEFIRDVQR